MPTLDYLRSEIERMRVQIARHRKEILTLQRAGISTKSAEALLERMLERVDGLCTERDLLKAKERLNAKSYISGKLIKGTPGYRRV